MEKLVYALWKGPENIATFNQRLLGPLRQKLTALGADRLQVNVADETVAPGAHMKQENLRPGPCAVVMFWVNSSHIRKPFEQALEAEAPRIAGYAVTESTVHADHRDPCRRRADPRLLADGDDPAAAPGDAGRYTGYLARLPHQGGRRDPVELLLLPEHREPGADRRRAAFPSIVEECFPIEAYDRPQSLL